MRLPTVVVRGDVLSSWLTVSSYSKSQVAAELGVSRGRISQILSSKDEPSAHLIAKLLILTQLPFTRLFRIAHSQTDRSTNGNGRTRHNGRARRRAAS